MLSAFRCCAIVPVPDGAPTVQTCKFKGLVNDGIQIKASFSEDGMFVVSGSEDGQVNKTLTLCSKRHVSQHPRTCSHRPQGMPTSHSPLDDP